MCFIYAGFISLRFGIETAGGLPHDQMFGFCAQKTTLDISQLGGWTKHQAAMTEDMSYDRGMEKLKGLVSKESTVLSTGFSGNSETLSLDYFRYIV